VPSYIGGLLRFEERLRAEVRVAVLPEGLDPDDLIRKDRDVWERLIAEAKSLVDYHFALALAEEDLTDAKGKARLAHRLLPVVAAVSDQFERAHYVELLARHLQVTPQVVEQELAAARAGRLSRGQPGRRPPVVAPTETARQFGLREYALSFLLRDAEALAAVDQQLQSIGLEPLCAGDFLDAAGRPDAATQALFGALRQAGGGWLSLRASLDKDLRQLFDWIKGSWANEPEADERLLWQDGVTQALRLRRQRLGNDTNLLRLALEGAEEPTEKARYLQEFEQVSKQLHALNRLILSRSTLRAKESAV
jgi:DNA primase